MTKIVVISDTHGHHNAITMPPGDILVHCGDATSYGSIPQVEEFLNWFEDQDYKYKIMIAGNHDFLFENDPNLIKANLKNMDLIYLQDQAIKIEGINFYGSPWQPWFYNWAFNLERGEEIKKKWDLISEDTDFLITHGPPFGILDMTLQNDRVGCLDLLNRINIIKPKYHAFGHIHEAYGILVGQDTTFINASTCNRNYKPVNKPIELYF